MQVNITERIDAPEGKRYCPVIVGPNGRIKPDWVMVSDRQEKHPEGAYYLDWNEDGKRRRISVRADAAAAYNSRIRKQRQLDAIAAGLIVSNPIEDDIVHPCAGDPGVDPSCFVVLELVKALYGQQVLCNFNGYRLQEPATPDTLSAVRRGPSCRRIRRPCHKRRHESLQCP